jgi:hypothetical protein
MLHCENLNELVKQYNDGLSNILDNHAPIKEMEITMRGKKPFTADEIGAEKNERRRLERKMKSTKLEIDEQNYKAQRSKFNALLKKLRDTRIKKSIIDNKDNPKGIFRELNKAMYKNKETPIPDDLEPGESPPDSLNDYFLEKTEKIRIGLDMEDKDRTIFREESAFLGNDLEDFTEMTQEEVKKLVFKSSNKFSELDPMPTWMLRDCIDEILPALTKIVNLSLKLGEMPKELKLAIIKPLLKKLGLDLVRKNYRPVSNLAFLGKLIERVVALQIVDHMNGNNLMDIFQSAYRMYHSTETTLLRIQNDILMQLDKGSAVILVLLDLSAAFDTIDHGILLKRMAKRCGIKGTVLKWIKSYLSDRKQKVVIDGQESETKDIKYGVPQGSVLGPILFTIYMQPLGELIRKQGLDYAIYADDTQLYIAFSPIDSESTANAKINMEKCIKIIKDFLLENKMKLNDGKTEILLMASPRKIKNIDIDSLMIGETNVKPTNAARNLGVMFDEGMKLDKHVSNICRTGFLKLRQLASIRSSLDMKTAKIAANAFVITTLDYANSVLYGLPKKQLHRIQLVQNAAARVVMKLRKHDHITGVLKELHWLPVEARLEYKLNSITWKALNGMAPAYIRDLLNIKQGRTGMRSNKSINLDVPSTRLKGYGDRAYCKAGPVLWNKLPHDIRKTDKWNTFKGKLKTHIFNEIFDK